MSQVNQDQLIIMKNILCLAQKSGQEIPSQRNLLNKWFQDSIKCYIFETIASPLIADELKLETSSQVKKFIHKQTDNNKPKYMGIIEQYYIYINKCKKQSIFIEKLQKIILNPEDITQQDQDYSYNTMKTVRKQFVCFLILKYFEMYGQQEIQSFYDLWNICYPEEAQKKKKLSKFDKMNQNKMLKSKTYLDFEQNSSLHSSQSFLNNSTSYPYNCQSENTNYQITKNLSAQEIENLNQDELIQQEHFQIKQSSDINQQKKEINNQIFEEDSYEEESMNHYLQYNNYSNLQQKEIQLFNQFSNDTKYFQYCQDQQQYLQTKQGQYCNQLQGYIENHTFESNQQEKFFNYNRNMNQTNQN